MLLHKNTIIVASAGSRKTTGIVEEALAMPGARVLLTTYTNENVAQIIDYIIAKVGHVPKHITVMSWFSFLLQEGVRPYQNHMTNRGRVGTIDFTSEPNRYTKKTDTDNYYLTTAGNIFSDKVSEFVYACIECSNGLPIKRLEKIYGAIFIDELQDLAAYDLNFLETLFKSSIKVVGVGDPRQATFSTNNSQKNKKFKRTGIALWIEEQSIAGLFSVEVKCECYRSNQAICDFADALFPNLPKTKSINVKDTGHDGIFLINREDVLEYVKQYKPVVLRWNKTSDTGGLNAFNIGITKGRTYERVLIFPTGPMIAYLRTKDLKKAGDLSKLYVAVTRAKYSVTFVI